MTTVNNKDMRYGQRINIFYFQYLESAMYSLFTFLISKLIFLFWVWWSIEQTNDQRDKFRGEDCAWNIFRTSSIFSLSISDLFRKICALAKPVNALDLRWAVTYCRYSEHGPIWQLLWECMVECMKALPSALYTFTALAYSRISFFSLRNQEEG